MKIYLSVFALIILSFSACDNSILETTELPAYTIEYNKSQYTISSENDLKELVQTIYKKTSKDVTTARIDEFEDEIGSFLAIKATILTTDNQKISFFAPLNKSLKKENNAGYSVDCTMTCSPNNYCDQCNHTIYERCKRQACSCSKQEPGSGVGQCSSSVTFGN